MQMRALTVLVLAAFTLAATEAGARPRPRGKGRVRNARQATPTPPIEAPPPPQGVLSTDDPDRLRTDPSQPRPWAEGVGDPEQIAAEKLFKEGNALLKESLFVKAAERYREALTHWDHPGIHYNLVLALLNLDQPLEVNEHLDAAMRFGAYPIEQDKLDQAHRYKTLIAGQLATLRVSCDEPQAHVRVDGRDLFTAPGSYEGTVRAGPHTVVVSKDGFLTNEVSRTLEPQSTEVFDMKLIATSDLTRYRRSFSTWVPWSVFGAGAVVTLAAGGMHYMAAKSYERFDQGIIDCGGCVPDPNVASQRSNGDTFKTLAIGGYAVGGAALIASAVLFYMNRLQPYAVDAQGNEVNTTTRVDVIPKNGGGSAVLQVGF